MAYKFISLLVVACILANTKGASLKRSPSERVAALYVKDGDSGELRFLGGGINSNAQLNQYITQKQNFLEQLRPTTNVAGTGLTGTGLTGTGLTGTGLAGTGLTGTGNGVVTPIVINAGGGNNNAATNAGNNAAIVGASPIAGLLPQIIAQAAVSRRGPNNNRRRVNQRRRGNNRRRGNKNGAQIYVVRPQG